MPEGTRSPPWGLWRAAPAAREMSGIDPENPRAYEHPARRSPRPRRLGRRLAALTVFLSIIAAVAAVVIVSLHLHPFHIGAVTHRRTTGTVPPPKPTKSPQQAGVAATPTGLLSAPLSRIAAVPYGSGGALLLGGLDAAGSPTDAVQNFQLGNVTSAGTLPAPDASGVAAVLGGTVYLFAGSSSTIYQLSGTSFEIAGNLPATTADAAAATVGDTAYVIGGISGTAELNTIVAFTPNSAPQTVATLPVTLRYATAVALGGQVYIIGGATAGAPSATVYRFDPTTNAVTTFTTLSYARDREAAATLGGRIYVIGGESASGTRSRAIYSINPATGTVSLAGVLPVALADAAAVTGEHMIILAGGTGASGAPLANIYEIKRTAP